jgi:subtilisin family serine protease
MVASNFGTHVDLSAPFWALSTVGTSSYENENQGWCGTSMATPHVSGAAALLWAQNPTWTNVQIRDRLFATAEDRGAVGKDVYFGWGIVDAAHAVGTVAPPPPTVSISGPTLIQPGATCTWDAIVTNGTPPFSYLWSGQVQPWGTTGPSYTGGKDPAQSSNSFTLRVDVTDSANGTGWASITVTEDPSAPPCIM